MTFRHAKLFNFSSLLGQFRCTGYSKTVSIHKGNPIDKTYRARLGMTSGAPSVVKSVRDAHDI